MSYLAADHPLVRALQLRYPHLHVRVCRHNDGQGYCQSFAAADRATLEAAQIVALDHLARLLAIPTDARKQRYSVDRWDGFGNELMVYTCTQKGTVTLCQHVRDAGDLDKAVEARVGSRRMQSAVRRLLRDIQRRSAPSR